MLTEKTFELIPAELGRELKQTFVVSGMVGKLKSPTMILLKRVTTELVDTIIERDELRRRLEEAQEIVDGWVNADWTIDYSETVDRPDICKLAAALRGEESDEGNGGGP